MRACHVTRRVTGITVFLVPKYRLPCCKRLTRYFQQSECTRYARKHVSKFPHTFSWFRYSETRLNRLELLGGDERSWPWKYFFFIFLFTTPPSSIQWLRDGSDDTGFESHLGKDIFLFPKTFRHSPGPTPATSTMDTRVISHGKSGRSVKLTNHLHPRPRLKMSGAIPLLPLYAFLMQCTGMFYLYPRHAEFAKSGGFFYRRNCASFYVFFSEHTSVS
jgi:hypothetical protein